MYPAPVMTSYDAIRQHCMFTPTAPSMVLGYTTKPHDYTVPDYELRMIPPPVLASGSRMPHPNPVAWHHWRYTLMLTRVADPGQVEAYYVEPGSHDTSIIYMKKKIYVVVCPEISRLAMIGEQEHVDDHWMAYTLTLLRAQQVISMIAAQQIVLDTPEGSATTLDVAEGMAMADLVVRFGALGVEPSVWDRHFQDACELTRLRDQRHWHSFGLSGLDAAQNNVWVKTARAGSNEVGVHASGTLVTFP